MGLVLTPRHTDFCVTLKLLCLKGWRAAARSLTQPPVWLLLQGEPEASSGPGSGWQSCILPRCHSALLPSIPALPQAARATPGTRWADSCLHGDLHCMHQCSATVKGWVVVAGTGSWCPLGMAEHGWSPTHPSQGLELILLHLLLEWT